jgi:putative transposase
MYIYLEKLGIFMAVPGLVKGVVFHIKDHAQNKLPDEVFGLMKDFRLMVNETIRAGILNKVTSKFALCKIVYHGLRKDYNVYSQYIPAACEVAGAILKNHRKRKRRDPKTGPPFVKRLYIKAENQTYKLDRKTGILRLPIRAREHVEIQLCMSKYHRKYLDDEALKLGSITICPDKIVIAFRKTEILKRPLEGVIALDTNERSLDGVLVTKDHVPVPVRLDQKEVPIIQARHQVRRSRLQQKKSHDRRMKRKLCGREGRREHNRIENRLRKYAIMIVSLAIIFNSAIALEDLTGMRVRRRRDKDLTRRLSVWPRRKLHLYIFQLAQWYGVPMIFVNPSYTSTDCPICGRRCANSRKDGMFRCKCGWECDQHLSASLNIFKKAKDSNEELARALKGVPDASWHDLMKSPYDLATGARTEASRMSGVVEV